MVVLLILAILLAIAIPTFLGVTKSANDRAAQSNLNTSLVNAKSTFQINGQSYALGTTSTSYSSSLAATMASGNPSLSYVVGAVTSGMTPTTVSVSVSTDGTGVALAEQAKGTNNCWFIIDNSTGTTAAPETWGLTATSTTSGPVLAGTWYGEAKNAATCSAAGIPAYSSGSVVWSQGSFPSI